MATTLARKRSPKGNVQEPDANLGADPLRVPLAAEKRVPKESYAKIMQGLLEERRTKKSAARKKKAAPKKKPAKKRAAKKKAPKKRLAKKKAAKKARKK